MIEHNPTRSFDVNPRSNRQGICEIEVVTVRNQQSVVVPKEAECLSKVSSRVTSAFAEHSIMTITAAVVAVALGAPPGYEASERRHVCPLLGVDGEHCGGAGVPAER